VTLSLIAIVLLFLRRPLQFLRPDVWLEDGLILLPDYVRYGARAVLRPVYDYVTLMPRLVNALAMQAPLEWYAAVSTAIAVLFDVFVVLCVAFCPTVLRYRVGCALMILLVPIYSEVYALPLYTLWFVALLPILAVFWSPDRMETWGVVARSLFVAIGGLSSPIAIMILPFFLLRVLIVRRRGEVAVAVAATITAAIQAWHVFPGNNRIQAESTAQVVSLTIQKFFGFYVLSPAAPVVAFVLGSGVTMLIVYAGIMSARRSGSDDDRLTMLLYPLLMVAILSSVVRWPIDVIDPTDAAPRYFFLPYVVLSWILLNLPAGIAWLRVTGRLLVVLAILNASSHFVRPQDPTGWADAARAHEVDPSSRLPVQMSGMGSDIVYVFRGEDGEWQVEVPTAADLDRLAIPHRSVPPMER